eukprot:5539732-Pyramimonas_sp.AAC.1
MPDPLGDPMALHPWILVHASVRPLRVLDGRTASILIDPVVVCVAVTNPCNTCVRQVSAYAMHAAPPPGVSGC